jgi:hypothetical protein
MLWTKQHSRFLVNFPLRSIHISTTISNSVLLTNQFVAVLILRQANFLLFVTLILTTERPKEPLFKKEIKSWNLFFSEMTIVTAAHCTEIWDTPDEVQLVNMQLINPVSNQPRI